MKNYRPQYHISAILKTFFQAKSDRGKEKNGKITSLSRGKICNPAKQLLYYPCWNI